jgi:hypothetical protein
MKFRKTLHFFSKTDQCTSFTKQNLFYFFSLEYIKLFRNKPVRIDVLNKNLIKQSLCCILTETHLGCVLKIKCVIPCPSTRTCQEEYDKELYKERRLVEMAYRSTKVAISLCHLWHFLKFSSSYFLTYFQ